MKSGIYVILPLAGPALDEVQAVQRRFDPRLAREWPPHATLAGSSGMGPISGDVDVGALRAAIETLAAAAQPVEEPFGGAVRFMQSNVVVLPLDPHGALRTMHEALKRSGIPYAPERFAFTPHVTLSFYPELDAARARQVLATRVASPARFEAIHVYRSFQNRTSRRLFTVSLASGNGAA